MRVFVPGVRRLNINDYDRLKFSLALSKSGYFDEALNELLTVLRTQSRSIYVHLALGNIFLLKKRYREATFHFEMLTKLDPLMPTGLTKLASAYSSQGLLKKAIEMLKSALDIDPKSTSAYVGMGQVYLRQKNFEKAASFFEAALELEPESLLALTWISDAHRQQKELDKAVFYLTKVLKIKPRLMLAYVNLGKILLAQKEYQVAEEAFRIALSLNPLAVKAKLGLADVFIATDRFKDAMVIAEEITNVGNQSLSKEDSPSIIPFEDLSENWTDQFDETSHMSLWVYSLALSEQEEYLSADLD